MKCMYWRPRKVSRWTIFGISLFAVVGLVLVESFQTARPTPHREEKVAAATLARKMMQSIKQERLRRNHRIFARLDPLESGMVGRTTSPVTTLPAKLESKQASVNPNFAAAVVQMLHDAEVKAGDVVAVGYSGSFPALNVAVCAALETLDVEPIIIASAASSSFGANHPDFMWLDMEGVLHGEGLISFRSSAASLGGQGDRLMGHSEEARNLAKKCLTRNGVPFIETKRLRDSIDQRMAKYEQLANDRPIKAYINVGGGAASIHGSKGKAAFGLGVNQEATAEVLAVDCVASRLAGQGVPVIHLGDAHRLAKQLNFDPQKVASAGVGPLYEVTRPNRWLAAAVLLAVLWTMRANILTDTMHRLQRFFARSRTSETHELRIAAESSDGPRLMV